MTLKSKVIVAALFLGLATGGAALAKEPHPHGDPALTKLAKISAEKARSIALGATPGTVKEWELEREKGGSGLRYSFDIQTKSGVIEVGVDAADGAILENGPEGKDKD